MEKICVFCGKSPESKSKEHVIPEWLISYTGPSDRNVGFGVEWETGKHRKYAFDKFTFPACIACNETFSDLEYKCKPIILDLLAEKPLSHKSISILLSWFDKIRIGLWLGYLYLDKNKFGIKPRFYIGSRINTSDRILLIYRTNDTNKHINFFGPSLPFFDYIPSCLGFSINQFYFVNISNGFLFMRRLGLPYPKDGHYDDMLKGTVCSDLQQGQKRLMLPLIRKHYDDRCTELYQPIINLEFLADYDIRNLYDNVYTRNYIDIDKSNIGNLLIKCNDRIVHYSTLSDIEWLPKIILDKERGRKIWAETTLLLQNYLIEDSLRPNLLDKGHQKIFRAIKTTNINLIKFINKS